MYIAIVDDTKEDALRLKKYLCNHKCDVFSHPTELLEKLTADDTKYDLYLLDIYMGDDPEGIELARDLRDKDADAVICFVSSSDEFYREAYDIQDTNYLLKPVSEKALLNLSDRLERRNIKYREQGFQYKRNGQAVFIPYKNILYINSNNHLLDIYCKDGTVRQCGLKLDDVEGLLDDAIFCRCHQSFIINIYNADSFTGSDFLFDKKLIPVSRRYLSDAKRRYQEILFEEVN